MNNLNRFLMASPASFLENNIMTVLGASDVKFQAKNNRISRHMMDLSSSATLTSTDRRYKVIDVSFLETPGIRPGLVTPGSFFSDAILRAFWLPWAPDVIVEADLDMGGPSFFFTAGFSGCSFTVSGDARCPHVVHSNMVDSEFMPLANVRTSDTGAKTLHNRKADLSGFKLEDIYGVGDAKNVAKLVGSRLDAARLATNTSQIEMAERLGVTIMKIVALEAGIEHTVELITRYADELGLNVADLGKRDGNFSRPMPKSGKYNRVYMHQELKSKVRARESGGTYRNDYFGAMGFEEYGGGQDEATGASGQASVVGYVDSGTGHWRFVCQHQTVNIPSGEVHLERVQCLICSNAPTACTCP